MTTLMKLNHRFTLALWALCSALLLALARPSDAAVDPKPPGKMAFQGFLTDGDGVARGQTAPQNFTITFRVYSSGNAATSAAIWAETQVVTVDKGHFSVVLGEGSDVPGLPGSTDLSPLFAGDNSNGRYLGLTVEGESEISPRIQFLAAPYAHLARYANELVGSSGTSLLKITSDRVGIGLAANVTPTSALEVAGTVSAQKFAGDGSSITNLNGANLSNASVADSALSSNVALLNRADQQFTGNLITRRASPTSPVAFLLYSNATERAGMGLASGGGHFSSDAVANDLIVRANIGNLMLQSGAGSSAVYIGTNGNVGVGSKDTSTARLMVSGGPAKTGLVGAYVNGSVAGAAVTHGSHTISIRTSDTIWCGATLIATSDARVKDVLGISNGMKDLRTLLGIEITDFRYKDLIKSGNASHKKVIAQQVEKVFPQAVSQHTDVVPDLYQKANATNGWVLLATNLKKGDRVRLIGEKNDGIHEVLEVAEGKFRTGWTSDDNQVFVYGREVNDFRTVDYDAIAMLNVSATQQIKKELDAEVKTLREENESLKARLLAIESTQKSRSAQVDQGGSQTDSLRQEVAELKKLVAQLASLREGARPTTLAAAGDVASQGNR